MDPSSAGDDSRLPAIPEEDEDADLTLEEWARELETELEPVPD